MENIDHWRGIFRDKARVLYPSSDPSHDFLHICRVVETAQKLAVEEDADLAIVVPAAYFHDFVNVPKDDPRRKQASRLSSKAAVEYLATVNYPAHLYPAIAHAIEAHSFSANITPETIEAKVVQDADRLDGLGAIGIARCFSTSTLLRRPYYCPEDPWGRNRAVDDIAFAIDHFPAKLFKVAETMQTRAALKEAARRVAFMRVFLEHLGKEIS